MAFTNIEIKARTRQPQNIRQYMLDNSAMFNGVDHQVDTYFNVPRGRLKLRQGNIENALIYYERNNDYGPKQSNFNLVAVPDGDSLKQLLQNSLGILVVVIKKREIYFIGNVKFHVDSIENLGDFVEIEASDKDAAMPVETLRDQCNFYMKQFEIQEPDLINISYSDMLMEWK